MDQWGHSSKAELTGKHCCKKSYFILPDKLPTDVSSSPVLETYISTCPVIFNHLMKNYSLIGVFTVNLILLEIYFPISLIKTLIVTLLPLLCECVINVLACPDIAGVLELKEETIESLLAAACLLQLSQVIEVCCNFLMKQLHPSNCLGIRSFADAQGCVDLLNVAHNYTMVRGWTKTVNRQSGLLFSFTLESGITVVMKTILSSVNYIEWPSMEKSLFLSLPAHERPTSDLM